MPNAFKTNALVVRWVADGKISAWYFAVIDGAVADEIRIAAMAGPWLVRRPGFGSVKVEAEIGGTRWSTSLFPYKASDGWMLPLKSVVRRQESIKEGDVMPVKIRLLEA